MLGPRQIFPRSFHRVVVAEHRAEKFIVHSLVNIAADVRQQLFAQLIILCRIRQICFSAEICLRDRRLILLKCRAGIVQILLDCINVRFARCGTLPEVEGFVPGDLFRGHICVLVDKDCFPVNRDCFFDLAHAANPVQIPQDRPVRDFAVYSERSEFFLNLSGTGFIPQNGLVGSVSVGNGVPFKDSIAFARRSP